MKFIECVVVYLMNAIKFARLDRDNFKLAYCITLLGLQARVNMVAPKPTDTLDKCLAGLNVGWLAHPKEGRHVNVSHRVTSDRSLGAL
jgi:hypothetical protein